MKLDLKNWQNQLLELITGEYQNHFRNRKVVWVQDININELTDIDLYDHNFQIPL